MFFQFSDLILLVHQCGQIHLSSIFSWELNHPLIFHSVTLFLCDFSVHVISFLIEKIYSSTSSTMFGPVRFSFSGLFRLVLAYFFSHITIKSAEISRLFNQPNSPVAWTSSFWEKKIIRAGILPGCHVRDKYFHTNSFRRVLFPPFCRNGTRFLEPSFARGKDHALTSSLAVPRRASWPWFQFSPRAFFNRDWSKRQICCRLGLDPKKKNQASLHYCYLNFGTYNK